MRKKNTNADKNITGRIIKIRNMQEVTMRAARNAETVVVGIIGK